MNNKNNGKTMQKPERQITRQTTDSRTVLSAHCSLFIAHCSLLIGIFFLLNSCRSAPQTPEVLLNDAGFIPLEPGAYAYIFADMEKAGSVLPYTKFNELMDDKYTKQMLDSTRSAVIAAYLPQSERRFQLAAWGSYPVSGIKMALGASREWKKKRSPAGASYWHSVIKQTSLAVDSGQAFALATRTLAPAEPFAAAPGVEVPEGFGVFRRGAALSCWIENPGPVINQKLEEMQIPLNLPADLLFAALFTADGQAESDEGQLYKAHLRIQFSGEAQARGLAALFTVAKAFIQPGTDGDSAALGAILFANPPVQDGRNLDIKTDTLSAGEISLLFKIFSL